MGCQHDLKKDYHKWIEVTCFVEGASTREASLGRQGRGAPPATWVNPPCQHHVAESSASLAARHRLAHHLWTSLSPMEWKIQGCSSRRFAKMWFCRNPLEASRTVRGPTGSVDRGCFQLDITGKMQIQLPVMRVSTLTHSGLSWELHLDNT